MANYNFIGGDGKSYGPYSEEQMRQFIAQNRVNAQTQVSADEGPMQPAGSYPELMSGASLPAGGVPAMTGAQQPMAASPAAVQSMVNGPAIFMMVLGILNIIFALFNLVMNLAFGGLGMAAAGSGAPDDGLPLVLQAVGGVVGNIVAIIVSSIIIIGSVKMKKLESYGLCMTASILCIVCCVCCIGIAPGIWSIVVLSKPEVKAAFR